MDREEAIEIVKKNYPHVSSSGTQFESALRELIPELKENEDEMIRKSLVEYFRKFKPKDMWDEMFSFGDVLSYLERQKDKREIDFAEGKVEGVKQTCQEIKDAMYLFEPKDLTPFELTFRDYIDSAIRYCLSGEGYQQYIKEWAADLLNIEKKKEQKPAEWSEEDEKMLACTKEILNIADADLSKKLNGYIIPITEAEFNGLKFGIAHCLSWLDLRLKSIRPQSKQEWTEKKNALLEWCMKKAEEYRQMDADFDGNVYIGNRHGILEVVEKIKEL